MAETFDEFKKKQERQRREAEKNTYGLGQFGESLMDRTLGVLKGTGQEALGLGSKALGSLSGILGGPFADDATNFSLMGDELRQRGYENFYKGYKEGPKSQLKSGEFDPLVKGELSKYLYPLVDDEEKLYTKYLKDAETKKRLDEENYDPSAAANEFGTDYGGISKRVPGVDDEFDNIFLKIKEREIASNKAKQDAANEKQALADEKENLDTFPKLSPRESIIAEKIELKEEIAAKNREDSIGSGADAYEKLQNSALEDIAKSKGETVTPATKEELLAKYKKEFYEATGLDPSGKADKSSALMAMGLALMQNKAGKGFNVGKMLSAVGEAGEKALPALTKAKAAAKAETVAAGKYALGRIQAGESAAAALAKEARAAQRARDLKILEFKIDAQKDLTKGLEIKSIKNVKFFNGFDIEMGRNGTGAKFALPGNALNKTQAAMSRINGALKKTDEIDMLLSQYDGNNFGGTAGEIGLNRAKAMANRFGANFEFDDNSKLDPRLKIESLGNSIIAEYKKMLTQESGNGISNTDVERLVQLLGKPGELLTIEQLQQNVGSIRDIFMSKKQEIDGVADLLQDPSYYALESEWEENKNQAMNLKRVEYTLLNGKVVSSIVPRISVISKD